MLVRMRFSLRRRCGVTNRAAALVEVVLEQIIAAFAALTWGTGHLLFVDLFACLGCRVG